MRHFLLVLGALSSLFFALNCTESRCRPKDIPKLGSLVRFSHSAPPPNAFLDDVSFPGIRSSSTSSVGLVAFYALLGFCRRSLCRQGVQRSCLV